MIHVVLLSKGAQKAQVRDRAEHQIADGEQDRQKFFQQEKQKARQVVGG